MIWYFRYKKIFLIVIALVVGVLLYVASQAVRTFFELAAAIAIIACVPFYVFLWGKK